MWIPWNPGKRVTTPALYTAQHRTTPHLHAIFNSPAKSQQEEGNTLSEFFIAVHRSSFLSLMDESEDESASRGRLLLAQLDLIFLSDPLIDELGFVHPSQLSSLHSADDSVSNDLPYSKLEHYSPLGSATSSTGEEDSHSRADCSRKTDHGVNGLEDHEVFLKDEGDDGLPYDKTAFWCSDHKLAISMPALAPVYKFAKAAFMSTRTGYKKLLQVEQRSDEGDQGDAMDASSYIKRNLEGNCSVGQNIAVEKLQLEDSLLSYSRALVLINCDHASAWNTRKQILLNRAANQEVLTRELHMAGVVLSCGPKSEETWAYRRWVITQMIIGGISRGKLDSLLEEESKLVEAVASGRSLMNYRAWRHRCWLVPQMSFLQVAIELHRTKLWAASHVADNCCFHYRRCLLLQLIKSKVPKGDGPSLCTLSASDKEMDMKSLRVALLDGPETRAVWKEEMDWIKSLIQHYIGRETTSWDAKETLISTSSEQQFVEACLSACSNNMTEDGDKQREFAATYKLWVLMMGSRKVQKENGKNGSQSLEQVDLSTLEQLLQNVAPHRIKLWEGLCLNFQLSHT